MFSLFIKEIATKLDCTIVTGLNEREGDKLFNSAIIVDKNGVVGKYRKLHLFMNEPDFFEPGNLGLPIFDFGSEKIGILICFDWMFPELWRNLALRGVSLVLHPSNLVLPFAQKVIPSYSITNRIFIATANRTGKEGNISFSGCSILTNPQGEYLCLMHPKNNEVMMKDIDLNKSHDKMITPFNHTFDDRRLDVFPDLSV